MKKLICSAVIALLLILGVTPAFGAAPGKGEITVQPGGAITSLTVRYNLDNLMGEPLVTAAYKWDSPTRSEIDYDTVVWLKIQDNIISTNTAFIRIGDGVPGKRGEWSMDFTGSNGWGTVLTQTWSGEASLAYVPADIAKQYWKNGFKVIGAELSRKFAATAPQSQKLSPPGKGEITVKPGGAITSLTVRYNLDSLMGEPLVAATYKWESPTRSEIDANTVVWLKIQDNANPANTAYIRIGDGVPGKRGEWSSDVSGSPSWVAVLVESWSGTSAIDYVDAAIAKQYWRNGFKVIGAELSKSYESTSPQDPRNYFGQWTHWEPLKDEPNIFFRLMCERYDAASQKYVWRMQIWRKSVRQVSMRVRLDDDFNKQKGTDYKAVNIQSDAKVEFPPTYLAVGRAHPNGGDSLPVSVNFTAEFTELQEPQQPQPQPKPQAKSLVGIWERYGDGYAGMRLRIDANGTATVIVAPNNGKDFYVGDIKFKELRAIGSNKWGGYTLYADKVYGWAEFILSADGNSFSDAGTRGKDNQTVYYKRVN